MVDNKSYALTTDNSKKIKSNFGTIRMEEFLGKKMGGKIDADLGLTNPGSSII
jgi:tRNA A58 N-methylase Trm61